MPVAATQNAKNDAEKQGFSRFWKSLALTRLPEKLRLDRLRAKLSLSALSDKNLERTLKWSKRLGYFAAGHAGIWLGIGAAVGLRALGICLLPASLGVSTFVIGTLLVAKSVIGNRLCAAVHKKCTEIKNQRAAARAPKAPVPAAAPAPGKLTTVSPARDDFKAAATGAPPPPAAPASASPAPPRLDP